MNESGVIQADITALQVRVADLESSLQSVLQEKRTQEADFAQKRAKFKEIFLTREDELIKEAKTVQDERDRLKEELLGLKTAASVNDSSKEQEIEEIKRRWQEEVASIQEVMNDATAVVAQETAMAYQQERDTLLKLNQTLTEELSDIGRRTGSLSEPSGSNILHGFTKTFRNLAGPGTSSPTKEEKQAFILKEENLEDSMMKAQKDADLLKSVVLPLEGEINYLKKANEKVMEENRLLHSQLQKFSAQANASEMEKVQRLGDVGLEDLEQRFQKLKEDLEREKAGRTDLELFVAVLQKQKDVSHEDIDKLREELKDVCKILESEKASHRSLMQTWQMANDQFLESQRLQMMDLRRLESVLTEEQQRQVMELQRKDHEREEQQRRVKELEEMREKHDREVEQRVGKQTQESSQSAKQSAPMPIPTRVLAPTPPNTPSSPSFFNPSLGISNTPNINPNDLLEFEMPSFENGAADQFSRALKIWEIDGSSYDDSALTLATEEESIQTTPNISLTEAQEQAITGITPEKEEINVALESARAKQEEYPPLAGKRVVSESEWMGLQEEIRSARENVGKPCNMCSNYEVQLQSIQDKEQKNTDLINSLRLQLNVERDKVDAEHKVRMELEESLKNAAEDAQSQINILRTKNTESETHLQTLKQNYRQTFIDVQAQVMQLAKSRDAVYHEVQNLQRENESLSGKRELHSSIMNDETFILPSTFEELQNLCFKYREDMVTMKVNTEHEVDMLKGKMEFMKEQHESDRHSREVLEQTLQAELDEYRNETILLRSIKDEYERERKTREELETALKTAQENRKTFQIKTEEETDELRDEVVELREVKTKLNDKVHELKNKVQGLQTELSNSEAVQMDFVKLSQSLQVELEKIRQAENEVRWEHEDDVDKCFSCKANFGSNKKRKTHCKHCGKIFCPECVPKLVESGPRRRKMPVCDVCHTLLVNDSAPYFSKEAPPTT